VEIRHAGRTVALLFAGAILGAGCLVSLGAVFKTYAALEVANNFIAAQTFSGGLSVTGGVSGLRTAADCTIVSCTATGQVCVSGVNLYACNTSTGFYAAAGAAGGSASTLTLTPLATAPATCTPGQIFHLTNGAICHCYAANSMENIGSQGVCQ